MSPPLTYWTSGGQICASSQPVSFADAQALMSVHLDEARAALAVGAPQAALRALGQAAELSAAFLGAQDWRAAGGGRR